MLAKNDDIICSLVQMNIKYSSAIFLVVLHWLSWNNPSVCFYTTVFVLHLAL